MRERGAGEKGRMNTRLIAGWSPTFDMINYLAVS